MPCSSNFAFSRMPVLSMPVAREINQVSDSDEDGGWWMLLHVFWGVLLYRSTCFSLHCVDVVLLDSTSQEPILAPKAKPVKPKSKAGAQLAPKPKVKGACKPKAKGAAKAKGASASKAKSSGKTAEPTEEVSPQDVNGDDESEVEEPPRKRPSASSKTLKQKPAAAAAKVKAEKAKKAEKASKISNPYFYSNLNQWGIKVDGKQKISVWLSVICCFSDEALSCL